MADFLARRWTRQPQGPVQIDRGGIGGSVRWLVHAPTGPRDLHLGSMPVSLYSSVGTWNPVVTQWGIAHHKPDIASIVNAFEYPANPTYLSLQELTVFAVFNSTGGGNSALLVCRTMGSSTTSFGIALNRGTYDGVMGAVNGTTDYNTDPANTHQGDDYFDSPVFAALTVKNGAARIYWAKKNGVTELVGPTNLGTLDYSRTDQGMALLRTGTPTGQFVGHFFIGGVLNVALPKAGIAALAENPYQLLKPQRTIIFSIPNTFQYARPSSDISVGAWTGVSA